MSKIHFENLLENLHFRIKECGWTSPPRAVVIASSSSTRLSNKTTLIPRDLNCIETDLKPTGNFHNHSLKFLENYQNELEQIKDEYRRKFHQDQTRLEDEITRLIHHEQMTFKHHQRTNSNHKRKHY